MAGHDRAQCKADQQPSREVVWKNNTQRHQHPARHVTSDLTSSRSGGHGVLAGTCRTGTCLGKKRAQTRKLDPWRAVLVCVWGNHKKDLRKASKTPSSLAGRSQGEALQGANLDCAGVLGLI